MRAVRFFPVLFVLAVALPACNGQSNNLLNPTAVVTTSQLSIYSGTLSPQTPFFYAFSPADSGTVSVTFIGLIDSTGATLDVPVTMGIGVPKGTGCATTTTVTASPGLAAQLKTAVVPGTYCIDLVDNGGLASNATMTVRLVYPIDPTVAGSAGTDTFASSLTSAGAATSTFRATTSGTATIRLDSLSPSATVGLAVGVPGTDNLGCFFTKAIRTPAGGTITMAADAGMYCVKVYDVGSLTGTATFSIGIAHP